MNVERPMILLGSVLSLALIVEGCSAGSTSTPTPPATATSAPASAAANPSATESASKRPALTETYTSNMHGISISYPAGWATRAANATWTTGWPTFEAPFADTLYDRQLTDHLFVGLASQPLAGQTGDRWAADLIAREDCGPTEPVTIDGAAGLLGDDCVAALVWVDERGYIIILYTSPDDPELQGVYDRAWLKEILATVKLHPEDALEAAPLATP